MSPTPNAQRPAPGYGVLPRLHSAKAKLSAQPTSGLAALRRILVSGDDSQGQKGDPGGPMDKQKEDLRMSVAKAILHIFQNTGDVIGWDSPCRSCLVRASGPRNEGKGKPDGGATLDTWYEDLTRVEGRHSLAGSSRDCQDASFASCLREKYEASRFSSRAERAEHAETPNS